jgi:hypothetical protein
MTTMTSKATLLGPRRGVVYAVHDSRAPSDEDWAQYVQHCRELLAHCPDPADATGFSITDGGAPNAKQRRAVIALAQEIYGQNIGGIRSAVVSDSALVRSVVTAFSWHLPEIVIFSGASLDGALAHAQIGSSDLATVLADLEALAAPMPTAKTAGAVLSQLRDRVRAR